MSKARVESTSKTQKLKKSFTQKFLTWIVLPILTWISLMLVNSQTSDFFILLGSISGILFAQLFFTALTNKTLGGKAFKSARHAAQQILFVFLKALAIATGIAAIISSILTNNSTMTFVCNGVNALNLDYLKIYVFVYGCILIVLILTSNLGLGNI